MAIEKRKHQRVSSLNLLSYVCLDEDNNHLEQGMGRTLDISQGGILIETHLRIEAKYILLLSVGFEDELVDIKGEVIYCRQEDDGMFQSGVRFLEADKRVQEIIEELVTVFDQEKSQS